MRPVVGLVMLSAFVLTGCCSTCGGKCPFSKWCGSSSCDANAAQVHGVAKSPGVPVQPAAASMNPMAQPTAETRRPGTPVAGDRAFQPPVPSPAARNDVVMPPLSSATMSVPPPPAGVESRGVVRTGSDLSGLPAAGSATVGSAETDDQWHVSPLPAAVPTAAAGEYERPIARPASSEAASWGSTRKSIGVTDTLPRAAYAPAAE